MKTLFLFTRKIKLKSFFHENENKNDEQHNDTKKDFYIRNKKSTWEPYNIHHTVNTFIEAFKNEIENQPDTKTKRYNNLNKHELKALEDLRNQTDIVITNADKGGAVVIQDTTEYIKEANRQLNNRNFYKPVTTDLTPLHNKKINDTIEEFEKSNIMTPKIARMLKTNIAKTPKFYTSPKIHKQNNPGRPVISSIECHTANISQYVDYHLKEHVEKLPSFIKDTTDFINKTKDLHIPDNVTLVTMDVSALYTNIPNNEGIYAVEETLSKSNISLSLINVIKTFLHLILTLNNFIFNGKHYLQIKGCAMGTKCAPNYANLFMGNFESEHIYPKIQNKSLLYYRFIDDIFLIWTSSKNELQTFLQEINQVHHSIKFTAETSETELNFLDTTVYIKNNRLYTKTYKKPSDRASYLHHTSYHPFALKKNIPYGQALRMKRINTEQKEYERSINNLKTSFLKRGYKEKELEEHFHRASNKDRNELLKQKDRKPKSNRIPFITTFNDTLPNIRQAIQKTWNILHIND